MVYFRNEKFGFKLNNDNFYVVMDFDNTITTSDSTNSWAVLENPCFIDSSLSKKSNELVQMYYPFELDYSLDFSTKSRYMQEWYKKNIDLFYEYGLTYDILVNCVKTANITFRSGFFEFLNTMAMKNIPVIVLSAGIGNVIYETFKLHNCLYDNVYIISNFIEFDNNDMLPFNNTIIHSCNKSLDKLPSNLSANIKNRQHAVLFGDLIEDLNMISKDDLKNSISFGFLEKSVDCNLNFYREAFDVVLTDNCTFRDVSDILNKFM